MVQNKGNLPQVYLTNRYAKFIEAMFQLC